MQLLKKVLTPLAAGAVFALAAGAAQADTYDFVITGDYSAHFQLNSSPTPDKVYDGQAFILYDQTGTYSGASTDLADLWFFSDTIGGGLEIHDFYAADGETVLFSTNGAQLYSGTEDAPTLLTGTFALTEYQGTGTYTLTVTNVSAVPEPESYAMLLGGLGVIGFVASRRRKA
jgi:hypothetical protein